MQDDDGQHVMGINSIVSILWTTPSESRGCVDPGCNGHVLEPGPKVHGYVSNPHDCMHGFAYAKLGI